MKRVLLITHGTLCEGYQSAVELIGGLKNSLDIIMMNETETLHTMIHRLDEYLNACNEDDFVIVCTDIAVGTTTKCVVPAVMEQRCYLITGINLPVLLELLLKDFENDPETMLTQIIEEGRNSMLFMNEILKKEVS